MGGLGGSQVCMVPLLDMINHAHPDTANTVVHQDERNGSFGCTAIKNITAGQEVRSFNLLSTMLAEAAAVGDRTARCRSFEEETEYCSLFYLPRAPSHFYQTKEL